MQSGRGRVGVVERILSNRCESETSKLLGSSRFGSDPLFGEVLCIFNTASEYVLFCMQEWRSNMYNADLGAFSVTKASGIKRAVSDMKGILVVPIVKHCNRTYVIPKFSTTVF